MSNPSPKPDSPHEPFIALTNAVKKGDAEAVRQILKDNPNYKTHIERRRTPLQYAAIWGHRNIVEILLEHGEAVNGRSPEGWTPLAFAVSSSRLDVAMALLNAGADVNSQTPIAKALSLEIYTPLHIAVAGDNSDMVHLLVVKGASVTRTAADGTIPLHIAVKYGRRLNTIILCAFGSEPYARNSNGETPFDYADKLRQPSRDKIKHIMGKWGFEGGKLLSLRKNLVRFVRGTGKIDIRSFLAYAVDSTDELCLEYAVEVGGAKCVDWKDSDGRTALHNAAVKGNFKGVELLLKHGADVDSRTGKRKWTALLMAVDEGHEQIVRILVRRGADLEAVTDQGDNAITLAKKWKHTQIVEFLESLATPQGLKVPPSQIPVRGGSPSSFQMIRADENMFTPPTSQATRRVRIVKRPKADESEANEGKSRHELDASERAVVDVERNPDNESDVEGGFDGGLFGNSPDSGLIQPKTFNELTNTWRYYFDFKEKDKKVKVTVLDTGIDLDHEDWLQPRALRFEHGKPVPASGEPRQIDRIKNKMNFCGGSETDVQDLDGHGTQVAGIILRLAPRADVDIARVCVGNRNRGTSAGKNDNGSSADRCPQPTAVAKAIDWAIENDADIINMSFGYEFSPAIVRDALKRAQKKRIVVFAAMSNGGSYHESTWPAREELCAIGIHSCDEHGNKSAFTPLPNPRTDNFMVVGDNVLTHWPIAKGSPFRLDSGTSFATPVAAAMAALILAFVEQSMCKANRRKAQELIGLEVLEELHENSGMIRLLKSVSFPGPSSGYLLIHPQLLWKDLQFPHKKSKEPSKCREHAWDVIMNALMP